MRSPKYEKCEAGNKPFPTIQCCGFISHGYWLDELSTSMVGDSPLGAGNVTPQKRRIVKVPEIRGLY